MTARPTPTTTTTTLPEIPKRGSRRLPLVLIVDDDDTILRSLRIALSSKYMVRTCNTAARGVVEARMYQPDLVLLDIRMPEHDGFWVFSEVRKFDPNVPIIFNSAYQDRVDTRDVEGVYKPFAYLPKSGRLDDILETFARAVEHIKFRPAA